jgi:hypothetical protein
MTCSINGYPIDVVRQYRPRYASKTTDHPVEKDSDFTDNIQANPFEFSMDCVISNTPSGAIANDPTRQGTLPAKDAWDAFVDIWTNRQPVPVVAPDGAYTNMVMDDLQKVMDPGSHGGLVFTVHFKKIVIVTNNRTTVRTALVGGGSQDHKGDRQAITLDPSSTWVISYPASDEYRKRASKVYGPPIVKGMDGGNALVKGKNDQYEPNINPGVFSPITANSSVQVTTYDRYRVDPLKVTPDGYVDKAGNYTPYQFEPPDGKFHPAPSLFNDPLNTPEDAGNSRFDKPNTIRDYLKNASHTPPPANKPNNQTQDVPKGSLGNFLKNGS